MKNLKGRFGSSGIGYSRLSRASLRISESLDFDTVLHEVAESARALTDAGCVFLGTIDDSGQVQDFATSGLSPEEHRRFLELPYGPQLWDYLREVPGPLRLGASGPTWSRWASPRIRRWPGASWGCRSVAGGCVSAVSTYGTRLAGSSRDEDEEVLALFASQAGSAISNARNYRDERGARTNWKR